MEELKDIGFSVLIAFQPVVIFLLWLRVRNLKHLLHSMIRHVASIQGDEVETRHNLYCARLEIGAIIRASSKASAVWLQFYKEEKEAI